MTRKTRAIVGAGALAVAGALVLSGCGGSSFDEPAESGDGGLTSSDRAPLTTKMRAVGRVGETTRRAVRPAMSDRLRRLGAAGPPPGRPCQSTLSTRPPVRATSSSNVSGKTVCGVPPAAQISG